jgi:hypothetical protein
MRFFIAVAALSFAWSACCDAQSPNDMINMFGGMMRSGVTGIAQSEWAKLSKSEIICIDEALSRRGLSVNSVIQQGIRPSDPRVFTERSSCRGANIAEQPTGNSTRTNYSIDGMSLGDKIEYGSSAYGGYACSPSEQFRGFSVCRKRVDERDPRGSFVSNYTVLHSADGTIAYLNRTLEPAFFKPGEAEEDIQRLSRKYGAPQILRIPQGLPIPYGMIAIWGQIKIEPLAPSLVAELAANRDVRAGFLVGYLGSFRRSAQLGLPIYRLSGGPGFIWIASWGADQRGILRFLAANPMVYDHPSSESKVSDQTNGGNEVRASSVEAQPNAKKFEEDPIQKALTAEQKAAAERAEADRAAAEKAEAQKAAEEKAAAEKTRLEREATERAAALQRAAALKAAAEEDQRKKEADFRAKGIDFVQSSNTEWVATSKLNEMTDKTDVVVRSFQKYEGAAAEIVGSCRRGVVTFSGLIVHPDGTAIRVIHDPDIPKTASVLYRFNDEQPIDRHVSELEFNNKFELIVLGDPKKVQTEDDLTRVLQTAVGIGAVVPPSKLWRVMIQFRTENGEVTAKIPIFAEPVQQLIKSCLTGP